MASLFPAAIFAAANPDTRPTARTADSTSEADTTRFPLSVSRSPPENGERVTGNGKRIPGVDKSEKTATFQIILIAPDGTERTITARGEEHIWDAALRAGIRLPALCHQGWCLTCAAVRLNGGCVDQHDSVAFYSQDEEADYALLCTGRACSDLRLRTNQARAMRQHRLRLHLPAPYANV